MSQNQNKLLQEKMIERLDIEEKVPQAEEHSAIIFDQERDAGDQILSVDNLSGSIGGEAF